MGSPRVPQNIFWSTITSLLDSELVTRELLYNQALHRIQDSAYYVLGLVAKVYQDFSSTNIGTAASITGSVDLTQFDFDSGIALSGLTLTFDEDTAAAQTVTFPNSITSIPLLLNELYSQAATNLEFDLTSDGNLRVRSGTLGVSSTLAAVTGTAAALLLNIQTAVAGSGFAADGASRIGLGTIPSTPWTGGVLRDFITGTLVPQLLSASDKADALAIGDGGTLGAGDQTISSGALTTKRMHFVVPAPVADANITLPTAASGHVIRFRMNPNPPFNVFVKRSDTTTIGKLSGTIGATTAQQWLEVAAFGGDWVVIGFGNSDDNQTLV